MPDRGFTKGYGKKAGGKAVDTLANLADGDTIDVGLQTIDSAFIQARNLDAGTDDLVVFGPDLNNTTEPNLQVWAVTPDGTSTGVAETDARDCVVVAFGE